MITEDLGKRIRELRQKTGLSQEKFALKIGMDRTYFASVEAGKPTDGTYAQFMSNPSSSNTGYNWHVDVLKAWSPENPDSME